MTQDEIYFGVLLGITWAIWFVIGFGIKSLVG